MEPSNYRLFTASNLKKAKKKKIRSKQDWIATGNFVNVIRTT